MRNSGGWIAAMVVATLFFLSTWGVFRGKRRAGDSWTSTWSRRREIIVLTVIWLIFFQAFALRFGRPLFAVLAAGLLYSLVRFLVAARQPSSVVQSCRAFWQTNHGQAETGHFTTLPIRLACRSPGPVVRVIPSARLSSLLAFDLSRSVEVCSIGIDSKTSALICCFSAIQPPTHRVHRRCLLALMPRDSDGWWAPSRTRRRGGMHVPQVSEYYRRSHHRVRRAARCPDAEPAAWPTTPHAAANANPANAADRAFIIGCLAARNGRS